MASDPTNGAARSLALAVHTDLRNLDEYAANPVVVAALLQTAEEKLAIMAEYLAAVRRAAGLGAVATILRTRAA
jgi:hypothetical protein